MSSEIFSDLTASRLGQTNNAFIGFSHDRELRKLICNRINNSELDERLINASNGHEASTILEAKGLAIDIINAVETPSSWIHAIYLSMD